MSKPFNQELFNEIIEILKERSMTGYDIYRTLKLNGKDVSKRLVYYYLSVGLKQGYLKVDLREENGKYSWGKIANKKYYSINLDNAEPSTDGNN